MKKSVLFTLATAVVVVALIAGCTSTTTPSPTTSPNVTGSPTQSPTSTSAQSGANQSKEIKIGVLGVIFEGCSNTTVKQGASVTWTNGDFKEHRIVSENGVFDSSNMTIMLSHFTHQFNEKGIFRYNIDGVGMYNSPWTCQIIVE